MLSFSEIFNQINEMPIFYSPCTSFGFSFVLKENRAGKEKSLISEVSHVEACEYDQQPVNVTAAGAASSRLMHTNT